MKWNCLLRQKNFLVKNSAFIIFFLVFTASCITIPKSQTKVLPIAMQKHMTSCRGEGSGFATLLKEKNLIGRYETDWSFIDARTIGIQILGVFGETIHEVSYNGESYFQMGKLEKILEPLIVKSDGFFNYAGHDLPIHIYELTCIFNGTYPKAWLKNLVSIQLDKEMLRAYFESEERLIVVESKNLATGQELCATYYWGGFLGLGKNELKWCLPSQLHNRVHLTYKDFELRWLLHKE